LPRSARNDTFQIHPVAPTPGIGFVSHACPHRRQQPLQPRAPMPLPVGAGQIGFVSHDGRRRRHWQPCRPLAIAVRAGNWLCLHNRSHRRNRQPCRPLHKHARPGIGFVLPRALAGPTRRNAFSTRHLPFVSLGRNWLCLARLYRATAALAAPAAGASSGQPGANWLCLARLLLCLRHVRTDATRRPVGSFRCEV